MFVLLARYTEPIEEVDRLLEGHKAWIGRNADRILLTAREQPLIGGLILARAESADEIWEMIGEDPFHVAGVAEYEVREYRPVARRPGARGAARAGGVALFSRRRGRRASARGPSPKSRRKSSAGASPIALTRSLTATWPAAGNAADAVGERGDEAAERVGGQRPVDPAVPLGQPVTRQA